MKQEMTLRTWLSHTEGRELYAILASTGDSNVLAEYYRLDGEQTPWGLYADTLYSDWFSVMPHLVRLSPTSPFLEWVAQTEHRDWGWLARSSQSRYALISHLRDLTKVRLPSGKEVFFRYWDGNFFPAHLAFMGAQWVDVLPVFTDYWINGETFQFPVQAERRAPETFPWWQVPQALLDSQRDENPTMMVNLMLTQLKKDENDLYLLHSEQRLREQALQIYQELRQSSRDAKTLTQRLCERLLADLQRAKTSLRQGS